MQNDKKGLTYWQKAIELSEETASVELLNTRGGFSWSFDEMLKECEKALGYARKTRDRLLIGIALDYLAVLNAWRFEGTDDPDDRNATIERALRYAEEAKKEFESISYTSPRPGLLWAEAPDADYYVQLTLFEVNVNTRRDLLEKAVVHGVEALRVAETTGYPEIVGQAHHVISKALGLLARVETDLKEKRRLLEKALRHREESVKIYEQVAPANGASAIYWNIGVCLKYLADLEEELSNIEKDHEIRRKTLEEAVSNSERGLQLCLKDVLYLERLGELSSMAKYGRFQYSHGNLLNRLYELTGNPDHQRKAIETFEHAAKSYEKLNLISQMAGCYWKVAKGYSCLGEHLTASQSFSLASNAYAATAEKIPQEFYHDYVLYMQAWSEIEKAGYEHGLNEYDSAETHFKKASELHEATKQWGYLAPNYTAWAEMAHACELSRKDQTKEAFEAFEKARVLFGEAKNSLGVKIKSITDQEEKQMITSLTNACDLRREYCGARMAFEEARALEKKGDHAPSAKKYSETVETLGKMIPRLESEQDRREFQFIIHLSQAWQKMAQAEAETTPALYLEASRFFEQARDVSPSERGKLLTMGHSRFCKALETGARFSDTRDPSLHSAAKQNLESAMDYYLKADFKKASEYAKATGLLLDAYFYMSTASKESDPENKAKLYMVTERVLQASAKLYVNADNPAKSKQVQRLLEDVKEQRELAVSLTEVLHAPVMASTAVVPSPTPTYEQAVGLERLEHAEVHEKIIASKKELKVGEILDLEIELVNPGKSTALLDRIEEAIPNGFEVVEKPQTYRVEGSSINMRGRKLDALKVEEVKFSLKPMRKGSFNIEPRILYLDENGNAKSHQPEPVAITVGELGIKGWIRGG